ncbi:hypothetical protein GCK32_002195 [Trichostrongylus colubriformis]|uniref:Uncharacterized protein n=1 Tax=Trichostrongylus colubriformis TaxID=6319 RepID=A0AAN8IWA4_TRICO
MIFEVPVDHFPQCIRPQRPPALILPQISILRSQAELTANVVSSPLVRRSEFKFNADPRRLSADILLPNRTKSMPCLAERRTSTPVLKSLEVPRIFSNALQILSTAVSLPQLA